MGGMCVLWLWVFTGQNSHVFGASSYSQLCCGNSVYVSVCVSVCLCVCVCLAVSIKNDIVVLRSQRARACVCFRYVYIGMKWICFAMKGIKKENGLASFHDEMTR